MYIYIYIYIYTHPPVHRPLPSQAPASCRPPRAAVLGGSGTCIRQPYITDGVGTSDPNPRNSVDWCFLYIYIYIVNLAFF